jgi:cell division protease FtsH
MERLHAMAAALIKYETIDSSQISDVMAGRPPRPPADWDDSEPKAGTPAAAPAPAAELRPDGKIGGPAPQH